MVSFLFASFALLSLSHRFTLVLIGVFVPLSLSLSLCPSPSPLSLCRSSPYLSLSLSLSFPLALSLASLPFRLLVWPLTLLSQGVQAGVPPPVPLRP